MVSGEKRILTSGVDIVIYQRISAVRNDRLGIRLRDGTFYVVDVNPNPDIAGETSMVLGAASVGYSYGEMISHIVELAALRHPIFSSNPSLSSRLIENTLTISEAAVLGVLSRGYSPLLPQVWGCAN